MRRWLLGIPPYAIASCIVKLLALDYDNQVCENNTNLVDGSRDILGIACEDTEAARLELPLAGIDVCCNSEYTRMFCQVVTFWKLEPPGWDGN